MDRIKVAGQLLKVAKSLLAFRPHAVWIFDTQEGDWQKLNIVTDYDHPEDAPQHQEDVLQAVNQALDVLGDQPVHYVVRHHGNVMEVRMESGMRGLLVIDAASEQGAVDAAVRAGYGKLIGQEQAA